MQEKHLTQNYLSNPYLVEFLWTWPLPISTHILKCIFSVKFECVNLDFLNKTLAFLLYVFNLLTVSSRMEDCPVSKAITDCMIAPCFHWSHLLPRLTVQCSALQMLSIADNIHWLSSWQSLHPNLSALMQRFAPTSPQNFLEMKLYFNQH